MAIDTLAQADKADPWRKSNIIFGASTGDNDTSLDRHLKAVAKSGKNFKISQD